MAITGALENSCNLLNHISRHNFCPFRRLSSTLSSNGRYQFKFQSYDQMVEKERSSAGQSILIEDKCARLKHGVPFLHSLNGEHMSTLLNSPVKSIHHYVVQQKIMSLVELSDYEEFRSKNSVLHSNPTLPISSRMIQILSIPPNLKSTPLATQSSRIHHVLKKSSKSDSVPVVDQVEASETVSEFGSKLRFFFLKHLEELLCTGTFSSFQMCPFGSSVNALGNDQSDLDLVMSPKYVEYDPNLVLMHQTRPSLSEKYRIRCLANLIGEQVQMFVPGILKSQKILFARVPIVKLVSDLTGLECDISFFNPNAVAMARGVFQMAKIEPRLVDLYSFLKKWSQMHDLTTHFAFGYNNFMLLSLLIAFMQTREPHLLPSMNSVHENHAFSSNDSTFSSDDLLIQFFEFLLSFDFSSRGFSILNGSIVPKGSNDVLYVENAFEVTHNVCKNINKKELDKLLMCAKSTLRTFHLKKSTASSRLK